MKNQKGIVWIPILIMVVAVAAFSAMAYLVWQKNVRSTETTDLTKPPVEHVVKNVNSAINTNINTNSAANTNSAVNTNTSANTNVSTAGWKTYENAQYHFSFGYPSNWHVEKVSGDFDSFQANNVASDNEGAFTVQPVTARGSGFPEGLTTTTKSITIGGKKATQSVSTYSATGKVFQSLVTFSPQPTDWGATAQILIQPDVNGNIDIPNQILSTFQFTQ